MPRYDEIVFENDDLKVKAIACRTSSVDSINDFFKVFHEDIEIKYFYEGSSTLCIGTENIIVEPGDVVVINPYEFHATVANSEVKGKYHIVVIGLDFFGSENSYMDLRYLFIHQRTRINNLIKGNDRLCQLIKNVTFEVNEKHEYYENVVRGIMLELFSLLLRDYRDVRPLNYPDSKGIRRYQTIYPAVHMIRADTAAEYSIEELSEACNVSKYHFCRIFKEAMGMSAVEYRNEYRLQTAEVLLRTTDMTVAEISRNCGFEDPAYFSRCYKNKFGISPLKKRAILSK